MGVWPLRAQVRATDDVIDKPDSSSKAIRASSRLAGSLAGEAVPH
ncbi:hypothetical protein ACIRQQ_43320 [Streptomyces fuscichromogenes]